VAWHIIAKQHFDGLLSEYFKIHMSVSFKDAALSTLKTADA